MFHSTHTQTTPLSVSPAPATIETCGRRKGPRAFQDITNVYQGKLEQPYGEKNEDLHLQPTDSSISQSGRDSERVGFAIPIELCEFDSSSHSSYHTPVAQQSLQKQPSIVSRKFNTATPENPSTELILSPQAQKTKIFRLISLPVDFEPSPSTEKQLIDSEINHIPSMRVNARGSFGTGKSAKSNNITSIQKYLGFGHSQNEIEVIQNCKNRKLRFEEHSSDASRPSLTLSVDPKTKYIDCESDRYYLQPIQAGVSLQCIVKRQRNESGDRYQIYEASTLKNLVSVVKDKEGYIFISNHERLSMLNLVGSKQQTVIAKLIPNFFGSRFTCYLSETPYKKNEIHTLETSKCQQSITIDYETSLFGLTGPRKISAFIPCNESSINITGTKHLDEIYEKERKMKSSSTVIKFKSKAAECNEESNSCALSYGSKPAISSIKNFIMIDGSSKEAVTFCKFGKDLFNLDIRSPFNFVQSLSLAISSLGRKVT